MGARLRSGTLGRLDTPRNAVVASGTAHGTPGTAVAVVIGDRYDGAGFSNVALTDAQLLAIARRDLRIVQTSGTAAAAFHFVAATAATGTVTVACTVASLTFDIVSAV